MSNLEEMMSDFHTEPVPYHHLIKPVSTDAELKLEPTDAELEPTDAELAELESTFTIDNIAESMHDVTKPDDRKDLLLNLIKNGVQACDRSSSRQDRKAIATLMFQCLATMRDQLFALPQLALVVKAKFHQLIRAERMYRLIPIYNQIFSDLPFANINYQAKPRVFTEEKIIECIAEYNTNLVKYEEQNKITRAKPTFEKGELVGVKDKEGKWFLSEVLHVFQYGDDIAYLIKYHGWGKKFNDFITDSYRIKKYSPRRDVYFRAAWRENQEPSV